MAGRSSSSGNNTGGIYESYGRGWIAEIPDEKENILKMVNGTTCGSKSWEM